MTAKNTAAETPTATTPDAAQSKQTDVETRAKSTICKDGTAPCPACNETKPVTTFLTVKAQDGSYSRSLTERRYCRDNRRASKRASRDRAAA